MRPMQTDGGEIGDQCSHEARVEEFDKLVPSEPTPDVINSVDGDGDVRYIGWHGCLAADVLALDFFGDDEVKKTKRLAHYSVVDQNATVQGARAKGPLRSAVRHMMHWRDPAEVLKILVFPGERTRASYTSMDFFQLFATTLRILLLASSHNVSFPFLPLSTLCNTFNYFCIGLKALVDFPFF